MVGKSGDSENRTHIVGTSSRYLDHVGNISICTPTGTRTPAKCLEGTCAIRYTIEADVPLLGLEPRSSVSKTVMLSIAPQRHLWLKRTTHSAHFLMIMSQKSYLIDLQSTLDRIRTRICRFVADCSIQLNYRSRKIARV